MLGARSATRKKRTVRGLLGSSLSDSLLRLRQALDSIKGAVPEELRASLDECRALYESKYVFPACIVIARGVPLMCGC